MTLTVEQRSLTNEMEQRIGSVFGGLEIDNKNNKFNENKLEEERERERDREREKEVQGIWKGK